MAYTDKGTVVALKIVDILQKSSLFAAQDVWYGDSDYIPRVPAATVEAGAKARELSGAQFQTTVLFEVDIMLYTAKLDETEHRVQLDADQLSEQVEEELHKHPYMTIVNQTTGLPENLVIHGFVATVEPGFALRNNEILRAAKITWRGQSKVRIHG